MSLEGKIYEFEGFIVDVDDKTVYLDGQKVNISLKGFEILCELIRQRPRVVDKRPLMDVVWAGSFVEEGNLTFTVSQLRKALNDNVQNPRIIETAHRRGYRFIADVKLRPDAAETVFPVIERPEPPETRSADKVKNWLLAGAAGVLLTGLTAAAWLGGDKGSQQSLPGPFEIEKLSTDGKVAYTVLSRDKRFVVYVHGTGRDKQSIWLRQLESGSHVELIPSSDDRYYGLALSPDSNFLYFARRIEDGRLAIFRVSIYGGIPAKIAEDTQGWMSISPDGLAISYVRCSGQEDDNCSLFVADAADGLNAQKLITRNKPNRIGANEFAPDGSSIAFAHGQTDSGGNDMSLSEVNVDTGAESPLVAERFFEIKSITWLKDRSLLVTATKATEPDIPIWHISKGSGNITRLTKDSEVYSRLSSDAGGSTFVATRVRRETHINVFDILGGLEKESVADASSITFAGAGRIIFSGLMTGNYEIWSSHRDGSDQRQLTNDPAGDSMPVATQDGRYIYFSSNRSGEPHLWRMNADGTEQRQVTTRVGGWPIFASLDGKFVYFHNSTDRTLWKISANGSDEQLVLPIRAERFSVSPDGAKVLATGAAAGSGSLNVLGLPEGKTLLTYALPRPGLEIVEHAWSDDGREVVLITRDPNDLTYSVWRQRVDGGKPQEIKNLGLDPVHHFALARDAKHFAVIQGDWKHDAVLLRSGVR